MSAGTRGLCLGVLVGCVLAGPAHGANFNMGVKVEGIRLGPPVTGPKVTGEDLKGKVVLLEFWGVN
jgi:hypothetical protein